MASNLKKHLSTFNDETMEKCREIVRSRLESGTSSKDLGYEIRRSQQSLVVKKCMLRAMLDYEKEQTDQIVKSCMELRRKGEEEQAKMLKDFKARQEYLLSKLVDFVVTKK